MSEKVRYIYTLNDPITDEVRYVGKTTNLTKRYCNHICNQNKTHTVNWIRSLKNLGLKPKIEILEITDEMNWKWLEEYWISQFKTWGFNLTNHLSVGGKEPTDFTKLKTKGSWNKGKKLPPEMVEKIKVGLKNSDHTKKFGRKQSAETILKRISKIKGVRHTNSKFKACDLIVIKHSLESVKTLSQTYNVCPKSIYNIKNNKTYKL
jgi:hydroxymethylpyrimidine pyrophosphatase-like HAD family hydrolase